LREKAVAFATDSLGSTIVARRLRGLNLRGLNLRGLNLRGFRL
jgi:hypothetical protein